MLRYIHSVGTSSDGRFIIVHDELDEIKIGGLHTSIYTMDIGDLRAPTFVTSFTGAGTATDHNGYTIGNRHYTAHYKRGLVVFDSSDPQHLTEIGYFDTFLAPSADTAVRKVRGTSSRSSPRERCSSAISKMACSCSRATRPAPHRQDQSAGHRRWKGERAVVGEVP